jgi:hypothetical protein
MTKNVKERLRYVWRGVEALIAVALLAVLLELVLVLANSPTPTPEIRFISRGPQRETTLEVTANNAPEKMQPAPEIALAALKPKARPNAPAPQPRVPRQANNPPGPPMTPPLLHFENLKRVIGFSPSPQTSYTEENSPKMVIINPVLLVITNSQSSSGGKTNSPGTTNAPSSGNQTNETKNSGSTITNSGPVFRLAVP